MASPQAAAGFLLYSTTRKNDDGSFRIFDTTSLEGLYDIRAEPGRVTCRLPVTERVQNRNGTLHGGCIATIVDIVGSAALITENKRGGVSLNINTNYLRPVPGGGEALIDAQLMRVGRNIGTIQVEIFDAATGKLCAQGVHVKFVSETDMDLTPLANLLPGPPSLPEPRLESTARTAAPRSKL